MHNNAAMHSNLCVLIEQMRLWKTVGTRGGLGLNMPLNVLHCLPFLTGHAVYAGCFLKMARLLHIQIRVVRSWLRDGVQCSNVKSCAGLGN